MSQGAYRHIPMSFFDSLADAKKTLKENSLTVLEFQTALMDWLQRPSSLAPYQQFMTAYGYTKVDDTGTRETLGRFLHENVKNVVSSATPYYVSPDMCEIVKMAAEDMPAAGLQPTDLPTDTGFLVFERPVALKSNNEADNMEDVRITAVAWQAGYVRKGGSDERAPGISYFLFTTPHDMAVALNLACESGGDPGRTDADEIRRENGPLPIYDFSGWMYNTPWFATDEQVGHAIEVEGAAEPMSGVHSVVDQIRRLLLATWRILNQTNIVTLDPNRPPRHIRRRAERTFGFPEDGDIVIIRMRREIFQGLSKAAGATDDEPWYSIRFPVRGHWHNYWVGPKGSQHLVAKYVLPYEKGPEGAPLVVRKKIFSLER